ncbi:MAG: phage head-tail connector protein [Bradyrhizobiaceae bacterium]|nr:phage head-tail connector protein [Bradyrhizobiaceae bacterium]
MPAILLTPPAGEPLSLAEAKQFLRVEHEDNDELVAALISAACNAVELATRRVLVTQTWRIVLDRWPASGRVVSPVNPLRTLEAARVFAADGTPTILDLEGFTLNTASVPGVLAFERANVSEAERAFAGIEIDVTAGYGDAEDVPAPLVQAIRLLLARAYEHRDEVRPDALPDAVASLLAPFRVLSI